MINYFNYFTEVEEHFVRLRGRNLLVSPLDWCLIELWRNSGVPLHVTLRGIERSFETAQRNQKSSPRSLSYCHSAILEAFEEYNRAMLRPVEGLSKDENLNEQEEVFSREKMIAYLGQLETRLSQHTDEIFRGIINRLGALRSEILEGSRVNYRQLDLDLVRIGSILAKSLKKKIGKKDWEELEEETRKEMKLYKKRLSKEMYVRLRQTYLERKIHTFFKLPEFSLLGMEEEQ